MALLVIIEAFELFFLAPLAATKSTNVPLAVTAVVIMVNVAVVLAVVRDSRNAVIAVAVATMIEFGALVLRFIHPTASTQVIDFVAALVFLIALTWVLGSTVFGPGNVTVHRIFGAVAIYLNVAAAFALAYRVVDAFGPQSFSGPVGTASAHTLADLVYFSFVTLTTTGFGDIVPIDPFARSLSNLESVIGQLYPATLLARLISLEIEHRRNL